jgi:hypothetical protein
MELRIFRLLNKFLHCFFESSAFYFYFPILFLNCRHWLLVQAVKNYERKAILKYVYYY